MNNIYYTALLCNEVYRDHPSQVHDDIVNVIAVENAFTDTQLFVFRNLKENRLYIIVRGSSSKTDWFNNFKSHKVWYRGIKAHRGYVRATESVIDHVMDVIAANPGMDITVGGHSLGGAVGVLIMVRLCQFFKERAERVDLQLITFGQRKVSTRKHLEAELLCDYVRVTNGSDVAPRTPYVGYSHAGTLIYLPNSESVGQNESGHFVIDPSWFVQWADRALKLFDRATDHSMAEYVVRLEFIKGQSPLAH